MPRQPNPKIDPNSPAARIAANYPSNSAFARAVERRPSTTQRWLEKGAIDADYHVTVLAALRRDFPKKRFGPEIFIDTRLKGVAAAAPLGEQAVA